MPANAIERQRYLGKDLGKSVIKRDKEQLPLYKSLKKLASRTRFELVLPP
jgi:hypothetical protein